jgi:hypothetical protein
MKLFASVMALATALSAAPLVSPAHAAELMPAEDIAGAKTLCANEWTKRGVLDQEMYHYCLSNKHEGYKKLQSEVNKYAAQPWVPFILSKAIKAWTKRGARDDEMTAYEFHKQADAFEDLEYEKKQPSFSQAALNACAAEYENGGFDMIEYCYKRKMGKD